MKAARWLLLACLAVVMFGSGAPPALAHGDEDHSAPRAEAVAVPDEAASASESEVAEAAEPDGPLAVLENVHPATVHFPIALLLMAAILEVVSMMGLAEKTDRTVELLLYGATIGAGIAALFGWIHTGLWFGGESAMQLHRWTGTALVPAMAGLTLVARKAGQQQGRRGLLRVGLLVGSIAILLQGYWGGELAHGTDHLFG